MLMRLDKMGLEKLERSQNHLTSILLPNEACLSDYFSMSVDIHKTISLKIF